MGAEREPGETHANSTPWAASSSTNVAAKLCATSIPWDVLSDISCDSRRWRRQAEPPCRPRRGAGHPPPWLHAERTELARAALPPARTPEVAPPRPAPPRRTGHHSSPTRRHRRARGPARPWLRGLGAQAGVGGAERTPGDRAARRTRGPSGETRRIRASAGLSPGNG